MEAENSTTYIVRQPHHRHIFPCHQHHQQKTRLPCHCHHHHHHRHHHHHHHHHVILLPHCCAVHGFAPPPNGPPFLHPTHPSPPPTTIQLQPSFPDQGSQSSMVFEQEDEFEELQEDDDEEEPIFVLTDEWREFFAKYEAKRKQAKKQARGKK